MNENDYYKAFIIYPNSSNAKQIADVLYKTISKFKKPPNLNNKIDSKDFKRVYKTGVPLTETDDIISDNLKKTIHSSSNLIVICTVDTPQIPLITNIIMEFKSMGKQNNIISVIVDGSSKTSIPIELKSTDDSIEPLAANLCAPSLKISLLLFRNTEKYRILASLLGCEYDDLKRRQVTYDKRKFMQRFWTAMILILLICAVYSFKILKIYSDINRTEMYRLQTESIIVKLYSEIPKKIEKYPSAERFIDSIKCDHKNVYDIINNYKTTVSKEMNIGKVREVQLTDASKKALLNSFNNTLRQNTEDIVDSIYNFNLVEGIDNIGIYINTYNDSSWFQKTHFGSSLPQIVRDNYEIQDFESKTKFTIKSISLTKNTELIDESKALFKKTKWIYIEEVFTKIIKFFKNVR